LIRAVLFDLDGTLVRFDPDQFLHEYVATISRAVAHLMDPRTFVKALLESTQVMVDNTGPGTNREAFWQDILRRISCNQDQLEQLTTEYYGAVFPQLGVSLGVVPHPAARPTLEWLIRSGYDVAIATNPIFPRVATEERLKWGGIHGLPYKLVSTYEDFHSCKPNTSYYEEVLETIGRAPEECIMVGNDMQEDCVAGELGMRTYLVEDYLIDRGIDCRPPDFRGSFDDMVKFLTSGELARL
jgi:FMN phosphatase YigB (HAD superfamily)